jgi:hypothetical protein
MLAMTRDDKMAVELFIAGIRGWEAGMRRPIDDVNLDSTA